MFGALKREAWPRSKLGYVFLILVLNIVGELQRKRTLAASRGFLAAARLSCCYYYYYYYYKRSGSGIHVLELAFEHTVDFRCAEVLPFALTLT